MKNKQSTLSGEEKAFYFIGLPIFIISIAVIVWCATAPPHQNTDPKAGWVRITKGLYKICDNGNLIYQGDGFSPSNAVVPNSDECS